MEKTCFDCKKTLQNGEEYAEYPINDTSGTDYIKCKDCHKKNPLLENFQKTEVYSRVVGYIRPVEQWNGGKKEEMKDRVTFKA